MITGFYASIFAIIFLFLSLRVIFLRLRHRQGQGAGEHLDLRLAIRTHANASEYAPITLILLLCYELSGGFTWMIHGLGLTLILARMVHFSGLSFKAGKSFGRFYGTLLNFAVLLVLSGFNLWNFIRLCFS